MNTVRSRLLVRCRVELASDPVYEPVSGSLFWVDVQAGHLWRWHRSSRDLTYREIGEPVGGVELIDGGGFLLAGRRGVLVLAGWDDLPMLWQPIDPARAATFGQGRCDPAGRFVAGTTTHDPRFTGALYRIDADGTTARLFGGIGRSNGLDWSPDGRFFYHSDALGQTVSRYRWDAAAGIPADPVAFVQVAPSDGSPDGLTVDSEGCLWLAVRGAGEIRRYAPDRRFLGAVTVPTPEVSGCTFGGPHRTELYITTAAQTAPHYGRQAGLAGGVFVVATPIRGQRRTPFPRHRLPPELLEPHPYELG